ncbi:Pre-mRNA-splicing factor ATP-dependent RNA helicase PRP16, partial [Halocaridina rubra]
MPPELNSQKTVVLMGMDPYVTGHDNEEVKMKVERLNENIKVESVIRSLTTQRILKVRLQAISMTTKIRRSSSFYTKINPRDVENEIFININSCLMSYSLDHVTGIALVISSLVQIALCLATGGMMKNNKMAHILEGSSGGAGGLIIRKIKKEDDEASFKKPALPGRGSILGLDKLAALKRKLREDEDLDNRKTKNRRNSSSSDSESDDESDRQNYKINKESKSKDREYRSKYDETPTYTGGVNRDTKNKFLENQRKYKEKYVHASSKDKGRHRDDLYGNDDRRGRKENFRNERNDRSRNDKMDRSERRGYDRRDNDRSERRNYDRSERRNSDRSERRGDYSSRSGRGDFSERSGGAGDWSERFKTPRFSDAPETPRIPGVRDTPSHSTWDEDENTPSKTSSWDMPTPSLQQRRSRDPDWSVRSSNRSTRDRLSPPRKGNHLSDKTPLPTPSYKDNAWMPARRDKNDNREFVDDEDRERWEEEEKRLDRQWYDMDQGYDETNNPFAD